MKIKDTFVVVFDIFTKEIVYKTDSNSDNYAKCCEISNILNETLKKHRVENVYYMATYVTEIDYENN